VVVDLWNSGVRVGPMALAAGEAAPARIGTVDLRYSFADLLRRRALVESLTLEGIDLHARRRDDGSIAINGIAPPAGGDEQPPAEPAGDADAQPLFGYGLQSLELVDSRLVFEDVTGGTLTVALDRFVLEDFTSWEPQAPGRLTLEGAVNDMPLAFTGTSTPFATPIVVELEGGLTDATLDKVAAFTGPTGLERQAGTLATDGRHAYRIDADGAIDGTSEGTVVVTAVDVATPEDDTLTAARVELAYDLAPSVAVDDTIDLAGGLRVELAEVAAATAAGEQVAFEGGRIGLADLALTKHAELRAGAEDAAGPAPAASGPAVSLLEALVEAVIAAGREILRHDVEGRASPSLALDDVELRSGAQVVRADALSFAASGLNARGTADTWSLATPLALTVHAVALDGDVAGTVGGVALNIDALEAETDLENARVAFDVDLGVDEAALTTADGIEAGLARLDLGSDAFTVSGWPGRGRAEGPLALSVGGLRGATTTGATPAEVEAESLDVTLAELRAVNAGGIEATARGRVTAGGTSARLAGATPLTVDLGALDVEVAEAVAAADRQSLAGTVALGDLTVETAGEPAQRVVVAEIRAAGIAADPAAAVAVERVNVAGLDAEIALVPPAAGTAPAPDASGGAAAGPAAAEGAGGGAAPAVRLGTLSVAPGAQVHLTDERGGEAVRLRFDIERFEAGPLDTGAPTTPTALALEAGVEDSGRITLDGSVTPLASPPDGDVRLSVEGFPLPLVSAYATEFAGVTIESGDLGLNVDAAAAAGNLAGQLGLAVGDLFLGEPSADTAARFEQDFGVPLDFAVGLLKNDEGVIDFDLPLSGTVEAPVVDYGPVVAEAISGAAASLLPTNWFGEGGSIAVEPVPFAAGSAALADDGTAVADGVAAMLASKATLAIRVCGKGARADLAALRGLDPAAGEPLEPPSEAEIERVLELALDRGRAVRGYLVERHGIAAERIRDCRTTYSFDSDAPPRADFQL
jgi:hypothetical protein